MKRLVHWSVLIFLWPQLSFAVIRPNTGIVYSWNHPDGTVHQYESFVVVEQSYTWYDAENIARSLTRSGCAGHLVTITSSAEMNFLNGVNDLRLQGVLGARLKPEGWRWDTGPEMGSSAGVELFNFWYPPRCTDQDRVWAFGNEWVYQRTALVYIGNGHYDCGRDNQRFIVEWSPGYCPVSTMQTTWGHVKALYRQ